MTGYERYRAMLAGESMDTVPRTPILMAFAADYIGSNYGAFASDYRVLVESNRRCAADFGVDQLSAISDPYRETQGFGAEIQFVRDGVPRCVKPPLAHSKDLSLLAQPDSTRSERMRDRVQAIEAYAAEDRGRYSILGWVEGPAAEAADLRGVTQFLIDLMMDEPFACELMDLCVEVGIAFARAQLAAGADTIGVGDAIASQVAPETYRTLILPRERRLFAGIKAAGGLIRLHICGDTSHLLEDLAETEVDIVDLDWQVDMARARRILGRGKALAGNLNPVAAVKDSAPDAIRDAVRGIYDAVGNPYLVNAGCEVPPGTPPENLAALCEPIPYRIG